MFRTLLALLCITSTAQAGRIAIEGVVANYVTARDTVDIEIWLDRPLEPGNGEWLWFTGGARQTVSNGEDGPFFYLANRVFGSPLATPLDYFNLQTGRRSLGGIADSLIRVAQHSSREEMRDSEMAYITSITVPADTLLLDSFAVDGRFPFVVNVSYMHNGIRGHDSVVGESTRDAPRLIHAPEPPSLVLLGLALIWLPRLRQRCVKWHTGREPVVPRARVSDA